jgi:hypothetical protein
MNRAEVAHRIAKQSAPDYGSPPPWAYKVAALVEGDEIVYLEALRDETPRPDPWTGRVVVLTNRRVVTAKITGPSVPSGSQVTCWARRSLTRLRLDGFDEYWDGRRETGLAPESRLWLEYRAGNELLMPLEPSHRQRNEQLAALLPSLLDDLDST